jgi:bifunctional DNA-binding transcriptional regulator/antitoxin component of YhaV-PrlF toxin-antitoxin module
MVNSKKQIVRKLTPIGRSILVTIPPYWLAVKGLEAGDLVSVIPNKNNELVIKPYKKKEESEVGQ